MPFWWILAKLIGRCRRLFRALNAIKEGYNLVILYWNGVITSNGSKYAFPVDFHVSDNRGFWVNWCYFNISGPNLTHFGPLELILSLFMANLFICNSFDPFGIKVWLIPGPFDQSRPLTVWFGLYISIKIALYLLYSTSGGLNADCMQSGHSRIHKHFLHASIV